MPVERVIIHILDGPVTGTMALLVMWLSLSLHYNMHYLL
jgi:hypothetical protein